MILVPPSANTNVSILAIEGALTAIAVAVAFVLPRLGSSVFPPIEKAFSLVARRRKLSVLLVGLAAFVLRLALLPIQPIPQPYYTDDFSFLFAADTFAHGHITNLTPPMWTHFETMHIDMHPAYMSMFFPAQGLALAAGKVLFGHPWFGQLLAMALMCAALCWMLQAWLPAPWALLGGILAILRLGLFSYWIDTYTGGGAVAALGGALVLGALPRLLRQVRTRDATILAIGILILANSRPYEGFLLCLPVALALAFWLGRGKRRPSPAILLKAAVLPVFLLIAGASWMAYYNYRNFGSPTTLPYTVNRATYAVAPHFLWQRPSPEPAYRYKAIHDYYTKVELPEYQKLHSKSSFLPQTLLKGLRTFLFFAEFALIPPLLMLPRVFCDRRIRFLLLGMIPMTIGVVAEAGIRPYYLAPFTAAFYAIGLQAMRHLKQWKPGSQPVGGAMQRMLVTLCFATAALDAAAKPLHLGQPPTPGSGWACECLGDPQPGAERAKIESALEHLPGQQLVLVRYAPNHQASEEWVYNAPEIDSSKVIWAREIDNSEDQHPNPNSELLRYYSNRKVWLVQPDTTPATLTPYPASENAANIAEIPH
jgi:hypothetical protein